MPLPLLFIGAAGGSALVGLVKNVKAGLDNSKANDINDATNIRVEAAVRELNQARERCNKALGALGQEKLNVLNGNVNDFLVSIKKIKNMNFKDSTGLSELDKMHIDQATFDELEEMHNFASSLLAGGVTGVAGGAVTAVGAYGLATTFATASTGTAIASLSGAAATNATLAFFGGGSLAAGGLGIAGGSAVLGGLVAGPALLVMGMITGAKAGKKLEEAYANSAKANETVEQLKAGTQMCEAICRRTYMFYCLLARLDSYFLPLIYNLQHVIEKEGTDFSKYSRESRATIAASYSIAKSVKAILDTPILNDDGSLTDESEKAAKEMMAKLNRESPEMDGVSSICLY